MSATAFEFNPAEPLSQEIMRLMTHQIARIEQHLRSDDPADERIHEVRKRIKETRALLRLVRHRLGGNFKADNAFFRDMGRTLSAARDAAALIEALEKLERHTEDRDAGRALKHVRHAFENSQADPKTMEPLVAAALHDAAEAWNRVAQWPALSDGFETMGAGLERSFRDGKRALKAAQHDPTPENFHELRKRVKDHWYHAQLLHRVWPEFMKRYAEVVEELSDALGDHHDLIVLRQTLTDNPAAYGDDAALHAVFAAVEHRRAKLESKALDLAAHVYAGDPEEWCARIREWWRIAEAQ